MRSTIRATTLEDLKADVCPDGTRKPESVGSFASTSKVEAQALLSVLELGQKEMEAGRVTPVAEVVARLRAGRLAR